METIKINGLDYIIDACHLSEINKFKWFVQQHGYAQTNLPRVQSPTGYRETFYLHQLVMCLKYNIPIGDRTYIDFGYHIDHINFNILDNRMENLDFLPKSENIKKRKVKHLSI